MQELFVQTDKKIIATLPRYTFDGRIVVVQSESEAERAVQYLSRNTELGIDTETRPSFRKGQQHKVALFAGGHCRSLLPFPAQLHGIAQRPGASAREWGDKKLASRSKTMCSNCTKEDRRSNRAISWICNK